MSKRFFKTLLALPIVINLLTNPAMAQIEKWQQEVDYTMDIIMDVKTHRFTGTQKLVYTNNSPDTLKRAYYHLYCRF